MKYIISESKLFNSIYEYINRRYDLSEIDWVHPYVYEDDGSEYENSNILEFFRGVYEGPDFSEFIFVWISPDEYEGGDYVGLQKKCPMLEINDYEVEKLASIFGNLWIEPMKKWFEDNFKLPVKTIIKGIQH
jgi:hypothetical protein